MGGQSTPDGAGRQITQDGRFVVFGSDAPSLVLEDTNGSYDVFVRDRQTSRTERISISSDGVQGNQRSRYASISGVDGRFVAFQSDASNLVLDDTNDAPDIFVRTR